MAPALLQGQAEGLLMTVTTIAFAGRAYATQGGGMFATQGAGTFATQGGGAF